MADRRDPLASPPATHSDALAIQTAVLQAQMSDVTNDVQGLTAAVKELRDTLVSALAGRPPWPVAAIITFETSAIVGLAVALATRR